MKHPTAYKQRLFSGESVVADSETLTQIDIDVERIMLGIRMREGLEISTLSSQQMALLEGFRADGHLELLDGRVVLTPTGRLIADGIVREITI